MWWKKQLAPQGPRRAAEVHGEDAAQARGPHGVPLRPLHLLRRPGRLRRRAAPLLLGCPRVPAPVPTEQRVECTLQEHTHRAQGLDRRVGEEAAPRHAGGYAHGVIVERARVPQAAGAGVEYGQDVAPAAEGAAAHPAADALAQRQQVGADAEGEPAAAVREPGRRDLVEDEERAVRRGGVAEVVLEGRGAGEGAAAAEHGLDADGGEGARREGVEEGAGAGDVVVGADDPLVREGHRGARAAEGEGERAAVVGALEDRGSFSGQSRRGRRRGRNVLASVLESVKRTSSMVGAKRSQTSFARCFS